VRRVRLADWHRWLAVPFAIALLMWVLSGLVMLTPPLTPNAVGPYDGPVVEWSDADLSPADLLGVLQARGDSTPILNLILAQLSDTPVYRVRTGAGRHMIDARSGTFISIDEVLAIELASARVRPEVNTERVELVNSHNWLYPNGPVPVYRVRFDTGDRSWGYVDPATGAVQYSSRATRLRTVVISLHELGLRGAIAVLGDWIPLRLILVIASLGLLGVSFTGYYLALRKWRRPRARRA
jgi:uncharacterized iron-regulated membrane protein